MSIKYVIFYSSVFFTFLYLLVDPLLHYLLLMTFHLFVVVVQIRVFYSVRIFLGLISTITETVLVVALSRRYGKRLACYVLAMLCLSSGCFFASTSMFLLLNSIFFSYLEIILQMSDSSN